MKFGFSISGTLVAPAVGVSVLIGAAHAGDAGNYYPKRSWGSFNNGEMNTSLLVFRDINRNGIYDLGDRQMSHVAVELDKPDGDTIMAWTNVSGFANFKMSVVQRDRDVVDPGNYTFRVVPPPGFSVRCFCRRHPQEGLNARPKAGHASTVAESCFTGLMRRASERSARRRP